MGKLEAAVKAFHVNKLQNMLTFLCWKNYQEEHLAAKTILLIKNSSTTRQFQGIN